MHYLPIAARGEVARLVAHVGGLNLKFTTECPDALKAECGTPGALPVLVHGSLKISQSLPITAYLGSIAPTYRQLTPGQHAKDGHVNAILADVIDGLAKVLFDPRMKSDPSFAAQPITEHANKWIPIIEKILPASGFINGKSFPTAADFAMMVMIDGVTPFAGCWKLAKYDPFAKAPKLKGIYDRTKAHSAVQEYLSSATPATMKGNPFGLPM